ncbi:MAG TPA: hypothetical protein VFE36_00665 [Candidatus Baltobacteraceae bacterium]|jgi:hypothetical protein|nr:hypothetical protein [Candidatus Baltobacteraceae bacterium]
MSTVASSPSWLNAFDPGSPSSLSSSLSSLLPSSASDPTNSSTPAGFNVLQPQPVAPAAGPSQYQQALDAFKVTADTFLIQSALQGYQPLAAPAVFGSTQAYYQGLNETAQQILSAGQSGNYGSVNALA